MLKKSLIVASFVLLTYSLLSCVRGIETPKCSYCGDISLQCLLSPGWNNGMAQSDDEWYRVNCGEDLYNRVKIRATKGGDYSLCIIKNQEPEQCPTLEDLCVSEGEVQYIHQSADETYWILVHKNSGDPGFEIYLYCSSGSPPAPTTIIAWDDPRLGKEGALPRPTITPLSSSYVESYPPVFWVIGLLVIVLAVVLLHKFIGKK